MCKYTKIYKRLKKTALKNPYKKRSDFEEQFSGINHGDFVVN